MDIDLFIENVKNKCKLQNTSPTIACIQAGLSRSFLTDIKRGRSPTIGNLEKLADYFGTSVSTLLGDAVDPTIVSGDSSPAEKLLGLLEQLNPEGQERLVETADDMVCSGKYSKNG